MPKCRNCGTRLTKFDTDICPVCGQEHPLEGVESDTVEVTGFYSDFKAVGKEKDGNVKPLVTFLSFIVGFLGVPFFYIKKYQAGFITLLVSLLAFASLFLLLFCSSVDLLVTILVSLATLVVTNLSLGIYSLTRKEIKIIKKENE